MEILEPGRDASLTPLFQALFVLQNTPTGGGVALPGLEVQALATGSGTAKFDLTLSLSQGEDGEVGFGGTLGYATDLFDEATVDRFVSWFSTLLAGAVANLDEPLAELPMMSAEEAAQLQVLSQDRRAPSRADASRAALARANRPFEPPRDGVEMELARIWETVLGNGPVSRDVSFFELGGQSLLGVRLMSRVHRRFGRNLPLMTLFTAPTVERMADLLRDGAGEKGEKGQNGGRPSAGSLVPLQPEGSEPPFFCVHPVGGSVLGYRELARALGTARPFYGIQATAPVPGEGIPEKAARYLEEIRRMQPVGPYFLGGWSLGALIAFEMARRLEEQGEEVALLALLDPPFPGDLMGGPEPSEEELQTAFARDLMGLGHGEEPDLEAWRPHFEVFRSNVLALSRYRPEPFGGRANLFLAREVDPEQWAPFLPGDVEIHPVPGGHYGLLREPSVQDWAARLRIAMTAAVPGAFPSPEDRV